MDTNASTGRFYPFTTPTSATLPSTASSPDPQYRRDSSGSDSVSDEDGSASQRSYPSGRVPQGYGGGRAPYGSQTTPPFPANRAGSATATIYVDDPPYVPPSSSRPSHPSTFVETGPDVPFNPPMPNFHSGIPSSMTSTTVHPAQQWGQ
ncbi:hypothetical protein L226DRAFT_60462 [Lentinus tigrinus ALCF2SS1-7]|uniref:Uncharacterized protein n=1 Tax=Lentinus tigrinus ALCF2SS1-6 TaxID=1328759 RepID=A0A5C2SD76_9APHY|nr:hypothetical protein L227DRAFT_80246 [Lentinus tigrinus ALCF2SS1-6]RPD75304.1 hypothetical protein L226DRAFT_60462 [Lentinus tigrinus ALCF2SS1-7]